MPKVEIPSSASLVRATLASMAAAALILVFIVLPREYGVAIMDVPKLYGIGGSLAAESVSQTSVNLGQGTRRDVLVVRLKPDQSVEVKLEMRGGDRVRYSWSTDGGGVNFNAHADPRDPAQGRPHQYGAGQDTSQESGTLDAVFDGQHGWYWKNRTSATLLLTLRTEGAYSAFRRAL
jgi:hypothetical protein